MERDARTAREKDKLAIGCMWKRCSGYQVRNQEEEDSASLKGVAGLYIVSTM
jgi:hypothetical protein